jgi:hypothetical protein
MSMHLSNAPNDSREFLTTASLEVSMILDRYINVHDDIFKFSLRKIIPIPGVFKRIDFQRHFESLRFAERDLENVIKQLPASSSSASSFLSDLKQYCARLAITIALFRDICGNLFEKADGTIEYSKEQYQQDLQAYHASIPDYQQTGARLNEELNIQG